MCYWIEPIPTLGGCWEDLCWGGIHRNESIKIGMYRLTEVIDCRYCSCFSTEKTKLREVKRVS